MGLEIANGDTAERARVEVSGRLLAVLPAAVEQTCGSFDRTMQRYINQSSLEHTDCDGWYARSELLETYTKLQDTVGEQILERVGRFLPELIAWQADVTTVSEALSSLDEWYDDLHRGHNDTIQCRMVDDHHARITLDTPYPALFEEGLVRGIGHQFGPGTVQGLVVDSETTSEGVTRVVVL